MYSTLINFKNSNHLISLALFLLALIPRLPNLGRFLTADEFLWVDRSRNFLAGLTNLAYRCETVVEKWQFAEGLACTLRTGHPGVTTMWTGSLGFALRWLADGRPTNLHNYVVGVSTNPLDASFVAPERLGTVIITSLWVVAVYWLARRLFGAPVALIAALLIALDPFHIALSRVIHHDALSTTFMTLSVLTVLVYWGQKTGRGWLIVSGVLAGFGFLSKSPALYLMPFVALVGLWFAVKQIWGMAYGVTRTGKSPTPYSLLLTTLLDGLLWFAAALAVVFIFWPAMWVIPIETVETVFFIGSKYAAGGHAKGNYFLGVISQDPGALFYPVTWLYRASPPALIGLIALPVVWFLQRKNMPPGNTFESRNASYLPNFSLFALLLLFIFGYYLLMTIGEKKQDRYFLPAYPWLNLLAAIGLVGLTSLITHHASCITHYALRPLTILTPLILIINGLLVAGHFPYYFTYYNPLLGGPKAAAKAMTIGWGEGLDLAADYLNQSVNPAHTRVSSWYQSTFAPYYHGQAISYSKEKGKALAGDYVIFYINQTQRRFPDDALFDYFENRFEPVKTITLAGIDYAWIYPSLSIDHYIEDQTYTGIASLLAWQWVQGDRPLVPGQPADFDLYWEYLGKQADEPFFFRLVDQQQRIWAEGVGRPVTGQNPPPEQWRDGEIVLERGSLTPPVGMPPGYYQLQIGFYTNAPAVKEGELLFTLPPQESLVRVGHPGPASFDLPAAAAPIEQPLDGSLTLLGASWPRQPVAPQSTLPLELYWQVEQPLAADAQLHLGLMNRTGEARQAWFNLTLAETFNPAETTWQPGDILRTRWELDLLPEASPGQYYFELVQPENTQITLPFGSLMIERP